MPVKDQVHVEQRESINRNFVSGITCTSTTEPAISTDLYER